MGENNVMVASVKIVQTTTGCNVTAFDPAGLRLPEFDFQSKNIHDARLRALDLTLRWRQSHWLIVQKNQLACYSQQADREYFSKPVLVEPLYCELATRLLYVRDPKRNCEFPVLDKDIVRDTKLTAAQRKLLS